MYTHRAFIVLILLLSQTASLVVGYPGSVVVNQIDSTSHDDEVLEAVFRYQIERCYKRELRKVYFLAYKRADPRETVMRRFERLGKTVRKYSESKGFYKNKTGEIAIFLNVSNVEFATNSVGIVEAYCGFGALEGSSYAYRVQKKRGKWRVTAARRMGFS